MNNDHLKLGLLALCWLLCLGTLFTSPTITQGNPDMGQLKTNNIEACNGPRRKRNECLQEKGKTTSSTTTTTTTSSCDEYEYALKKCEKAVKQAYQHINLGGCPFEIKSSNLCDAEWCQGGSNFESCQNECSGVRESLSGCVHKHILSYFHRFGLKEDGTSSISSS